ncbi:MAG: XRE family transcriptional regulator [Ancrocorticia sp.]
MAHNDPEIAAALDGVGPRIQALRERRGYTLADISRLTSFSTSTLSRLETGQRKASLELLLPLARIYGVPLDDLVGAPETGDPRIRLRPRRVNGRTVVPLTRQATGTHAWKILVPVTETEPRLKTHEGATWIYVLSGVLRLVVGTDEWFLEAGEAAEFSTETPHWFGSDGTHEAEILTIFGPQNKATSGRGEHASPTCLEGHAAAHESRNANE